MNLFLLNLLLAVLWMFLWSEFDLFALTTGFAVGYLLIGLYSRALEQENYGTRGLKLLSFSFYFMRLLVKANFRVAGEVLTPGHHMQPRIIRCSVQGLTPMQITALANAVSLTPGSVSVDLNDDNTVLYVHCMYAKDEKKAIAEIDELRRRLMMEVFE